MPVVDSQVAVDCFGSVCAALPGFCCQFESSTKREHSEAIVMYGLFLAIFVSALCRTPVPPVLPGSRGTDMRRQLESSQHSCWLRSKAER